MAKPFLFRHWQAAIIGCLVALLWVSVSNCVQAQIPDQPTPPTLVTDFANLLQAQERQALEQKLLDYEDSTSTQVAVVTVTSLQGYDVAQFADDLALKWKIGQKSKNNGVLLLIAPTERKMTIQTGYGVEAKLTDALTFQIIENELKPAFRQQQYYQGIDAATTSIFQALAGEYHADAKSDENPIPTRKWVWVLGLLFLFFWFASRFGRRGGGGTTLGGGRSRGFIPPIMFFPSGGGGGSWGGGGGGGGGFGGFGGGSFGGGGSSGSW